MRERENFGILLNKWTRSKCMPSLARHRRDDKATYIAPSTIMMCSRTHFKINYWFAGKKKVQWCGKDTLSFISLHADRSIKLDRKTFPFLRRSSGSPLIIIPLTLSPFGCQGNKKLCYKVLLPRLLQSEWPEEKKNLSEEQRHPEARRTKSIHLCCNRVV